MESDEKLPGLTMYAAGLENEFVREAIGILFTTDLTLAVRDEKDGNGKCGKYQVVPFNDLHSFIAQEREKAFQAGVSSVKELYSECPLCGIAFGSAGVENHICNSR